MPLAVSSLARNNTSVKLNKNTFRDVLEDHLQLLAIEGNVNIVAIYPNDKWKWQGDFYGMLKEKNIPPELQWVTMRIAGLDDPNEFDEGSGFDMVIVPDQSYINTLASRHNATLVI